MFDEACVCVWVGVRISYIPGLSTTSSSSGVVAPQFLGHYKWGGKEGRCLHAAVASHSTYLVGRLNVDLCFSVFLCFKWICVS